MHSFASPPQPSSSSLTCEWTPWCGSQSPQPSTAPLHLCNFQFLQSHMSFHVSLAPRNLSVALRDSYPRPQVDVWSAFSAARVPHATTAAYPEFPCLVWLVAKLLPSIPPQWCSKVSSPVVSTPMLPRIQPPQLQMACLMPGRLTPLLHFSMHGTWAAVPARTSGQRYITWSSMIRIG